MIELINFIDTNNNYKLMYKWCNQSFIYEWFEQKPLSYDEIVNKYKNKLIANNQKLYIINYNNIPIGFTQIYEYKNDIKCNKLNNYKNIYEYDLFIGEESYLSKGLGSKIINIINSKIYQDYKADVIILKPFKRNIRAIKCYLKCNFNIIKEYDSKNTIGNKETIVVMINKN